MSRALDCAVSVIPVELFLETHVGPAAPRSGGCRSTLLELAAVDPSHADATFADAGRTFEGTAGFGGTNLFRTDFAVARGVATATHPRKAGDHHNDCPALLCVHETCASPKCYLLG